MNVRVVYKSKKGHTKRLAEAIARGAGVQAESVEAAAVSEPIDMLFIGGALYAGNIDKALENFLNNLTALQVKKAVIFGTSAKGSAIDPIRALLGNKHIAVVSDGFFCKGGFLWMNRGKPDEDDLMRAEAFAKGFVPG